MCGIRVARSSLRVTSARPMSVTWFRHSRRFGTSPTAAFHLLTLRCYFGSGSAQPDDSELVFRTMSLRTLVLGRWSGTTSRSRSARRMGRTTAS